MSKDTVSIAAVGCGRVAQHYRGILESGAVKGWQIAAVCDLNSEAASALAAPFQAKAYTDLAAMLREVKPDLTLILTPSGLHAAHARQALEAGSHVLVEKPLALRPEDGRALIALAQRSGLLCGVAFQNRLNPAVACLKKAVVEGRFGKIVTAAVRLRWCRRQDYYEDGWHGTWAQDGGVINQQAIHHVDALNWVFGPVSAVSATLSNRLNRLEAEDTLVAAVRFKDGALGTIEATTAARPRDFEASLSVVGEGGTAVVGGIALNKIELWSFVSPRPEDAEVCAKFSQDVPNGYGLSHGPLLQGVIDALRAGRIAPPVSGEDGLRTTELIHALYRSDETKRWVELSEKPVSERLGRTLEPHGHRK